MSIERLESIGLERIFQIIKSILPTKTSDLDNDSGFVTESSKIEILDEESTEANTTPDKYVSDAMVTRELLLRQNGVQWLLDEETGAIKGYKTKAGADAVFPFSSGNFIEGFGALSHPENLVSSSAGQPFTIPAKSGAIFIGSGEGTTTSGVTEGLHVVNPEANGLKFLKLNAGVGNNVYFKLYSNPADVDKTVLVSGSATGSYYTIVSNVYTKSSQ